MKKGNQQVLLCGAWRRIVATVHRRFGGTYRLYFYGPKQAISRNVRRRKSGFSLFLVWHIFNLEDGVSVLIWTARKLLYGVSLSFSRRWLWRISPSGKLRRVVLVRTYLSEEHIASIIRVTRIGEIEILGSVFRLLVTADVVPSSPIVTLMMEAIRSTHRSTQSYVAEDTVMKSRTRQRDACACYSLPSCRHTVRAAS
jgi:hypothetical protein